MNKCMSCSIILLYLGTLVGIFLGIVSPARSPLAAHAESTVKEIILPSDPATNIWIEPWGVALDNQGNAWIAAPECDPNPVCPTTQRGLIVEVNTATFSVVYTFVEPAGYSSPLFVATDTHGNVWFTEPMGNAIGELTPNVTNPAASTW